MENILNEQINTIIDFINKNAIGLTNDFSIFEFIGISNNPIEFTENINSFLKFKDQNKDLLFIMLCQSISSTFILKKYSEELLKKFNIILIENNNFKKKKFFLIEKLDNFKILNNHKLNLQIFENINLNKKERINIINKEELKIEKYYLSFGINVNLKNDENLKINSRNFFSQIIYEQNINNEFNINFKNLKKKYKKLKNILNLNIKTNKNIIKNLKIKSKEKIKNLKENILIINNNFQIELENLNFQNKEILNKNFEFEKREKLNINNIIKLQEEICKEKSKNNELEIELNLHLNRFKILENNFLKEKGEYELKILKNTYINNTQIYESLKKSKFFEKIINLFPNFFKTNFEFSEENFINIFIKISDSYNQITNLYNIEKKNLESIFYLLKLNPTLNNFSDLMNKIYNLNFNG